MTMKVTALYVYPIKALRGIELKSAQIGPQGIDYDRRFMLYEVRPSTGELKKIQLDSHPLCALFDQQIVHFPGDGESSIIVRFLGICPAQGSATNDEENSLKVSLEPDTGSLSRVEVVLHDSPASAYRMGDSYDAWFSQRLGVPTILVYLGDGRRAVLGKTLLPKPKQQQEGWVSSLTSYITGSLQGASDAKSASWLTFSDVAPLLVASESSLRDVRSRFSEGDLIEMYRFRPNIVVDGEGEDAWAEDFWAELAVSPANGDGAEKHVLQLTGNCVRCISLNVDYETGKPAAGELGEVLKRLMKDRRVDAGSKWSPVFGRYAFPDCCHTDGCTVSVGDHAEVTRRNTERSVWDWPGL
ncbi:hypothetical protein N657DRAFT_250069 [Parathielavia appendiculata]|uniref:MOSC domain-containing protein n=1 Tax=Parathielavia appendiculata TaxID=2587402 RepID=A0AAN6TSE3_9PEZI|nr:hypothetical protein N657DRAFT_250069 [Parathielavia appendiculata]